MIVNIPFLMTEILIVLQFLNPIADFFPSYLQIGVFFIWMLSISKNRELVNRCFSISIISGLIMLITVFRCILSGKIDLSYFSPMQAAIERFQFFVYPCMFSYIIQIFQLLLLYLIHRHYPRILTFYQIQNLQPS